MQALCCCNKHENDCAWKKQAHNAGHPEPVKAMDNPVVAAVYGKVIQ